MNNRLILLVVVWIWTAITAQAQIITADPAFPKVSDAVTITFDATQGTGGLADCNCDVYLHTGVITSASANASDWKNVVTEWGVANDDWKMERVSGEANLYQYTIEPSIREFYDIGNNETVEQMAFVFRDANGNLEGKATGGEDIYYEVFSDDFEFTAILQSPTAQNIVADLGESIPIRLTVSAEATISVFEDGVLRTEMTGQELDYELPVEQTGTHLVEIVADAGNELRQTFSFNYAVPLDLSPQPLPADTEFGITLMGDTAMRLALYAPGKEHVFAIGDFSNWMPDTDFQLANTPDGATWWIDIGGLNPGENVRFQYLVDGEILIADPYSRVILDPVHDGFIPQVTYPDLPPYPEGLTTGIVTLVQPGAPVYEWATDDFQAPPKEELVVYELLIRDFIDRHDYATLIDTLSYLDELGVNAIELMPVNEFEGNISWGYNPSYHLSLDKYYGTINEFKRFVDSCHARDIAVILDVVYNHAFSQSPLAQLYWDDSQNRPATDNPWLNPEARHPFNVGSDFNHESQATRTFVDQAMKYWLSEFRVDGFRFDLSKGFTQTQSFNVGTWNQYDTDRIATLKHYADVVWNTNSDAYVILEHFAENREEEELSAYGMMLWAGFGVHDNYLEAAMGYSSNLTSADYASRGWEDPHLIAYMESHDEERMMYKNINFGNSSDGYNVKDFSTALDRIELASAFFYTVPGPKMLWQFGELGYDFPINYCPNGTVNEGCRTDPKPIRWDYFADPERRDVYEVVRSLAYLKTNFDVFNTGDYSLVLNRDDWKTIHLRHSEFNVAVQGNFDVSASSVSNPFPNTGWWYEYFSGDSLLVQDATAPLALEPGEYRLYTTERIERPDPLPLLTSRPVVVKDRFELDVYPNPTDGRTTVTYQLEQNGWVQLKLYDALGRRVQSIIDALQPPGPHHIPLTASLAPGAYILRLQVGGAVETRRIVVME